MPKFTVRGEHFFRKKSSICVGLKAFIIPLTLPGWQTQPKSGLGWAANYF
jgi:hypothetical protein